MCHDYDHDGLNNAYHVNAISSRAVRYSDKAVQENYHVAESFAILNTPEYNFMKKYSRDDFKTFRTEALIRQQRCAEVAHAHEHDRLQARGAEHLGDHFRELLDLVAQPARAERAEVSEVLAQLRGLHARRARERLAGNRRQPVLLQAEQAAQINRQAINRLARNLGPQVFFHDWRTVMDSANGGKQRTSAGKLTRARRTN